MIGPTWKLISFLLALGLFCAVGARGILMGDELIWSVLRAIGAFAVSWLILGQFGNLLDLVVGRQEKMGTSGKDAGGAAGLEKD